MSDPEPDRSPNLVRSTSARTIAWCAVAASALAAVLTLAQVPLTQAVPLLGLPGVVAAVAWTCYLRPAAELGGDEITLVNVASTHVIPFSRIDEFDLRLGLTIRTKDGKKYGAWALPGSSRRPLGARSRRGRTDEGRRRVEPHVPEQIQQVLDAHAVWKNDADSPVRGPERDVVSSRIEILPPLLLVAGVAWGIWGLRTAAGL